MTVVEEIRAKIDVVELIGETVPLKQSGQTFKANCPFHNERTPSFYVYPDRQSWHCFGACAIGGDAFSFVMKRDGVGFGDALRMLAARAGIELETKENTQAHSRMLDQLRGINRAAAMFFHESLLSDPEAHGAREHLQKRGFTKETMEDYRLGYSSSSGAGLLRSMAAAGYSEESVVAAGLFRKRQDAPGIYPFFRNRLMVPIQDAKGDYAGFGARELDGSKPKYINSAQSPIFDKSAVLYGLYRGAEAIKRERMAVLVEGYMDVLMAHQYGFRNVVAAMGTTLSDRQVAALRRLASTFVLALDPDAAGDEATLRSLESSWRILEQSTRPAAQAQMLTGKDNQELVLKVIDLPRGIDPDDVIRADPSHWTRLIVEATPVVEYIFTAVAKRLDLTKPQGKASLTQRLAPFILHTPNVFEQNERIRKLAALLGEDEDVVKLALGNGVIGMRRGSPRRAGGTDPSRRTSGQTASLLVKPVRDSVEAYCIAMLLRYPELVPAASGLSEQHFGTGSFQEIHRLLASGHPPETLRALLPEELEEELDWLLAYTLPPGTYKEREHGLAEIVGRLQIRQLKLQVQALEEQRTEDPSAPHLAIAAEELRGRLLRNYEKSG